MTKNIQKIVKEIRITDGFVKHERKEVQIVLYNSKRAIERGTLEYVPTYYEIQLVLNHLNALYGEEIVKSELEKAKEKIRAFVGSS